MTYGEAWRLTNLLAADPSSQVGAALSEWDHPATLEYLALATIVDQGSKQGAPPYPRPFTVGDGKKRYGNSPYSPEETRRILDAHRRGTP